MGIGARHDHLAGLQRLTQRIQRLRRIFRQFIQKQHAIVRQRHLARLGPVAAAGQGRHRGRVMWRPERPLARQPTSLDQPGHRPDHGGLQQLARRQRRQQARQTLGQHRLARAGRADEQQIVPACRRDLERALGAFLTTHLVQVGHRSVRFQRPGPGRAQHLTALEMIDQADQRARGQHRHLGPGPGGLGTIGLGADQPQPHAVGGHCCRQGPADRHNPSVEAQLSQRRPAVQRIGRDHPHGGQKRQGDGQVEMAAFLGQVGGGQIGDDAPRRKGQSDPGKGPAHPLAAFGHRLVGQADQGEAGLGAFAAQNLDLGIDATGIHPVERNRHHPRHHGRPSAPAE
jgi:hypothetical protein